jgi:hypothetical protein
LRRDPARVTKGCPSSTVTGGPPGGAVGGCAWTSVGHVSAPNRADRLMIALVSQARPDGDAEPRGRVELRDARRRRAIDADGAGRALEQVDAPDGAVAALRGRDRPALGRRGLLIIG